MSRVANSSVSERYWQRVRIDRLGHVQVEALPTARDFVADWAGSAADADLQQWLVSQWRDSGQTLAGVCLECFISNQMRDFCGELAQRFGREHDFCREDLLPLVLLEVPSDDGKPPLLQRIRDSFQPERGNLSTWTVRVVKSDRIVRRFLLERGIEQVTDWLILNRANPGRLERVLRSLNATAAEREQAQRLLAAYHQCYRDPLLQQRSSGTRSRYPNPSDAQLTAIAQQLDRQTPLPPQQVLLALQQVAQHLRADRIRARGGSVQVLQLSETMPLAAPEPDQGNESDRFLVAYRQQFDDCLTVAVAQTIENRVADFQRGKTTPKARQKAQTKVRNFLAALQAFHCQSASMTEIAVQLDLKDQPSVSRLLDLKHLRADIARTTLSQLKQAVLAMAQAYISSDRLQALEARVQAVLAEEVEAAMSTAQKEASTGYNRAMTSNLALAICRYLDRRRQA